MLNRSIASVKFFQTPLPDLLAFAFVLLGYPLGVYLLFSNYWLINLLGLMLTAETLIISAYLIHEFSHWSIFKSPKTNERWANIMAWINGSCYTTYQAIRDQHMKHHVDRADVLDFNVQQLMNGMPAWIKTMIVALEWLYIPAFEIMMHFLVILLPFFNPQFHKKRLRILAILAIRVPLFVVMALVSLKAWLLYLVAYCIMLTVLRFADAFQHTYDVFLKTDAKSSDGKFKDGKLRDRAYEHANTFSNLASIKYPWLNLLFLNFPYHNAHHEKPVVPWHKLPEFHKKLYGDTTHLPVIPMSRLLKTYHKNRIKRVVSDDYGVISDGPNGADQFVGGVGVSFLTAI
ncbi:fatty acid desaturase family protein [Methyloradius palustris]|nr:fatty acid desaturase [Methyloradius palustris]